MIQFVVKVVEFQTNGHTVGSPSSCYKEQDAFRSFIEQYELSAELWNSANLIYFNNAARNSALEHLIHFLMRIISEAHKRENVKKVNSLWTNYRKRLRIVALIIAENIMSETSSLQNFFLYLRVKVSVYLTLIISIIFLYCILKNDSTTCNRLYFYRNIIDADFLYFVFHPVFIFHFDE